MKIKNAIQVRPSIAKYASIHSAGSGIPVGSVGMAREAEDG
jgi:hypothetical protein